MPHWDSSRDGRGTGSDAQKSSVIGRRAETRKGKRETGIGIRCAVRECSRVCRGCGAAWAGSACGSSNGRNRIRSGQHGEVVHPLKKLGFEAIANRLCDRHLFLSSL